jgi:hypothetical protein
MSLAFTKFFNSLLDSSVWDEPDHVRLVWVTLLVMADRFGRVHASVSGVAHRARVPRKLTEEAIAKLESPDVDSRSTDHEGRRIVKIDGGWLIVNYIKYRETRDEESRKVYQREWAKEHRQDVSTSRQKVSKRRHPSTPVDTRRHASTQAEAEAEAEKTKNLAPLGSSEPQAASKPEGAVIDFPVVGAVQGKTKRWWLMQDLFDELSGAFPGVQARAEVSKARAWCIANQTKRKTVNGMPSFLFKWFERQQNGPQGGGPMSRVAMPASTPAGINRERIESLKSKLEVPRES